MTCGFSPGVVYTPTDSMQIEIQTIEIISCLDPWAQIHNRREKHFIPNKEILECLTCTMSVDGNSIIQEIMSEKGVSPSDIPDRTKRQGVRGYAQSKCEKCNRSWSTYRAHIVFDLKQQEVDKIYKQKCKRCKQEHVPTFRETEFRELVEKAIEKEEFYRNRRSNDKSFIDDGGRRGPPRRPPHENTLCEKCGYGKGKNCWER